MSYAESVRAGIEYVGEPLVLRKKIGGTFSPTTNRVTGESNSDSEFTGRVKKYEVAYTDGVTVLMGDLEVIGVGFKREPVAGDFVLRDSRVYSVISVDPEVIDSEVQFYRLQVRGV